MKPAPGDLNTNEKTVAALKKHEISVSGIPSKQKDRTLCYKPSFLDIKVKSRSRDPRYNSSKFNELTNLNSFKHWPNQAQGIVELVEKTTNANIRSFIANMIGPSFALTAAHNLFDKNGNPMNLSQEMKFFPSYKDPLYEPIKVIDFHYPKEYKPQAEVGNNKDFAVLILEKEIHTETGYFGLHACDEKVLRKLIHEVIYVSSDKEKQLLGNQAKLERIDEDYLYYSIIESNSPLNQGCLYYHRDGDYYIIGIPHLSTQPEKIALRTSMKILNQIFYWMEAYVAIKMSRSCYLDTPILVKNQNINVWSLDLDNGQLSINHLTDWKALDKLHTLNRTGSCIGSDGMKAIIETDTWKTIKYLRLSDNNFGNHGAQLLSEDNTCCSLELLDLSKNQIDNEGLIYLTTNNSWNNLKALDLSYNYLTNQAAMALYNKLEWKNLHTLFFSHNCLRSSGAAVLAQNTIWINLHTINLSHNRINIRGGTALAQNKSWTNLNTLILSWNRLNSQGVTELAQNESWINLKALYLDSNNIDDKGAAGLARNKAWTNLEIIHLAWNEITDRGVRYLTENNNWAGIHTLDLSANNIKFMESEIYGQSKKIWSNLARLRIANNKITSESIDNIERLGYWRNLKILDLSGNKFSDESLTKIVESEAFAHICLLNLSSNNIFDSGVEAIAQNTNWTVLTTLILSNNCICPDGVAKLAQNSCWPSLKELVLNNNNIGNEGSQKLALNEAWINLKGLYLSKNNIGNEGAEELARNNSWKVLSILDLSQNKIDEHGAITLCKNKAWTQLQSMDLSSNLIFDQTSLTQRKRDPKLENLSKISLKNDGYQLNLLTEDELSYDSTEVSYLRVQPKKFQVPEPSHHFVGRVRKLDKMAKYLNTFGIVNVSGRSGVGKTEFISQFVNQNRYSQILWFNVNHNLLLNQIWLYNHSQSEDFEMQLPIENELFSKLSQNLLPNSCLVFDSVIDVELILSYFHSDKYKDKTTHKVSIKG